MTVQIPSHQDFCQVFIRVASNFSFVGGPTVGAHSNYWPSSIQPHMLSPLSRGCTIARLSTDTGRSLHSLKRASSAASSRAVTGDGSPTEPRSPRTGPCQPTALGGTGCTEIRRALRFRRNGTLYCSRNADDLASWEKWGQAARLSWFHTEILTASQANERTAGGTSSWESADSTMAQRSDVRK